MTEPRFATIAMLVAFAMTPQTALADDPTVQFVRGATRQESYEATLRASGLPVLGPWMQVGPFVERLRVPVAAQENPAAGAIYDLESRDTGGWQPTAALDDGHANTLDLAAMSEAMRGKSFTVCLRRTIAVDAPTRLPIFLGADTELTLWLNGKPVLFSATIDPLLAGEEFALVDLPAGESTLVLKLFVEKSACSFFFLPDFGEQITEELVARLDREFSRPDEPLEGYRARALRSSATAEERHWRLVEIEPPPGAVLEGTGMACLPNGRLALATRRGFVYLIDQLDGLPAKQARFQRYAQGLHEPLGLGVVDGQPAAVNRGEVTRLVDTDGDDEADRFETLGGGWGISGNYHEYAYGLPADASGNLYVALNLSFPSTPEERAARPAYRGWVMRITPDGRTEPVCCGLRSPNGIGANAVGDIFCTDNQGNWVPACPLYHVQDGKFFGHPDSLAWASQAWPERTDISIEHPPRRTLPAVWFPYEEMSQSATDVVCDTTGGRFGPFAGQLFVGEMTKGLVARAQLEKVAGEYQGACFLARRGLGAVNRMAFGHDGHLYFARANRGWGGGGLGDGLARLEFTGETPMEIASVHLRGDGFELVFTKPLAAGSGERPSDYELEQWRYHYWATYGSPKIDLERVAVTRVEVAADRRGVRMFVTGLKAERVCRITVADARADDGDELLHADAFYTLNRFPE